MTAGQSHHNTHDSLSATRPGADPDQAGLTISRHVREGVVFLVLGGELDLLTGPGLTAALVPLLPRRGPPAVAPPTVVFDLSALTFLDTTGLAALTSGLAAVALRGWRARYSRPRPQVGLLLRFAVTAGWFPPGLEHADIPARPGPTATA